MQHNAFTVRIDQGIEVPGGYVKLYHNTQYSLMLLNQRSTRCDAVVEIDGKSVGTWRIDAQGVIMIERPAHDSGKFTFYQVDTPEALQAGIDRHNPHTGLIRVTFAPEQPPSPPLQVIDDVSLESDRGVSVSSAGGTGLSGRSNQQFSKTSALTYDYSQRTIIHLRLIAQSSGPEPRPLTRDSTPVPPPISQKRTWLDYIQSGRVFLVIFDKTKDKFDDRIYTGNYQTDPMGTLKGGEIYAVRYLGSQLGFETTGYNQDARAIGTWTYNNAVLESYSVSLWGRIYTYSPEGEVFDREYGLVGHLEPHQKYWADLF